ncbi:MAG: TlpA disulfide reductase family protein [Bacteroidota bacterium]
MHKRSFSFSLLCCLGLPLVSIGQIDVTVHFQLSGSNAYEKQGFAILTDRQLLGRLIPNKETTLRIRVDSLPIVLTVFEVPDGQLNHHPTGIRSLCIHSSKVAFQGDYGTLTSWKSTPAYPKQWVLDSLIEPYNPEQGLPLLRAHPELPGASKYLYSVAKKGFDPSAVREVYSHLTVENRTNPYGRNLRAMLYPKTRRRAALHQPFLDFEAVDAEGKRHRLRDYIGEKYVLLDFGSWGCGPCIEGVPTLAKIDSLYGDQIEVINVWSAPDRDRWQRAVHLKWNRPISWQDWWDFSEYAFTQYTIDRYPTFFIIDPEGNVKYSSAQRLSGTLLGVVEQLLAPPAVPIPRALQEQQDPK